MNIGNTTGNVFGLNDFWVAAGQAKLGVVMLGGILGGLLQPVVARINPKTADPPTQSYYLSPILGLAAAGISVYVLAASDLTNPIRLLFFALLSGLAFPAVLSSAVDNVARRTTNTLQAANDAANRAKSNDPVEASAAAKDLGQVLALNPSDSIKQESKGVIDTVAQQAVNNIAQTPTATPTAERQIVEDLQAVGTVAKTTGWEGAVEAAATQLSRLSETMDDEGAKAAAADAAERLSDPSG